MTAESRTATSQDSAVRTVESRVHTARRSVTPMSTDLEEANKRKRLELEAAELELREAELADRKAELAEKAQRRERARRRRSRSCG